MAFEIYGSDMSDPTSRENLVGVVSALRELETDFMCDTINGFDLYAEWAENDPESYRDFVDFCANHPSESARHFIAHRGDYLIDSETDFTFGIYQKLLADQSQKVRTAAAENIEMKLAESDSTMETNIVTNLGLSGLSSFLRALQKVRDEKQSLNNTD